MKLMLIEFLNLMQHFDTCQIGLAENHTDDGADTDKDADTDNDADYADTDKDAVVYMTVSLV